MESLENINEDIIYSPEDIICKKFLFGKEKRFLKNGYYLKRNDNGIKTGKILTNFEYTPFLPYEDCPYSSITTFF